MSLRGSGSTSYFHLLTGHCDVMSTGTGNGTAEAETGTGDTGA